MRQKYVETGVRSMTEIRGNTSEIHAYSDGSIALVVRGHEGFAEVSAVESQVYYVSANSDGKSHDLGNYVYEMAKTESK